MNLAIFDIDGTLTNTNHIDAQCYVRAVHIEFAIDVTGLNWADYTFVTDIGITDQMFQERFGRRPTEEEIARLQRRLVALLEEAFRATPDAFAEIPGANAALAWLRQHPDWTIAIATGCWQASAHLKLRSARIPTDDLPAAFCEDGHAREEVVRTAHARALVRNGVDVFQRVVSIGDGIWDVTTAKRLALPFVGICAEGGRSLCHRGATHVMRDLTDVKALLRCLEEAEVPGDGSSERVT
jgi:phosphoglycolate phosphatase-like HAD superfamily hydrolase